MDITNLQNFLLNQMQTSLPASGGRNGAAGSRSQQKADSFASKLNNAVERSGSDSGTLQNETTRPFKDVEKPAIFKGENDPINETPPKQPTADGQAANIPDEAGSERPLLDVAPEIPGPASPIPPMPLIANIIGETAETQFSTLQDNFFHKFLERPVLTLTAEDLKGLPPEAAKILENMFANINNAAKGQIIPQAVAEEFLAAAKQEWDALLAKGELLKTATNPEPEVSPPQPGNTAKQPQNKSQLTNPTEILAKPETILAKPETVLVKPEAILAKPETVLAKPETVLAKPETVLVKPETVLVKPETVLAKPETVLVKPETETQKTMVEIAKIAVIDTTKPAAEIVKPNLEQQNAAETAVPTTKDATEQNPANRQNTGGQQTFGQMAESNPQQIKNSDQPVNNSQPFAVFAETAPQNQSAKPVAAQPPPQQTSDFTTPRDDFQIKTQIVQQAILINRAAQESEMLIRLKPEHLGEMALKVTVANGVVNATFHSNNADVRAILENSLQQLKNDLANAGFKVDNVSISAGLSQFSADQERAMQWQQQQSRRFSGKTGEEGYADTVEGVTASQQGINTSKDDGVDYRI